jgi:glutathione-specific gamma-glutamylcyclotransferase
VWVFGYGSLIFRPSFPYAERAPAWLSGYSRRFWQGSTDHRGVPGAPGRVVTLVQEPQSRCWGVAYRIDEADTAAVIEHLDHREKGGYERKDVPLEVEGHGHVSGSVYFAGSSNPSFLGPAPLQDIVAQIRSAHGPSGSNADYVKALAAALREANVDDPHVFEVANAL